MNSDELLFMSQKKKNKYRESIGKLLLDFTLYYIEYLVFADAIEDAFTTL